VSQLPEGYQYIGLDGGRARRRRMMQSLAQVKKLADEGTLEAMEALAEAAREEPDPDAMFLHLVHAAWVAAQETGTTWAESVAAMLQKFAEAEDTPPAVEAGLNAALVGR
jgi:hypothetical protein